jgi:hypothetical protein
MVLPIIPAKLEDWDMPTLNNLIMLRDIERETFDFKGPDFKKLHEHLCAFANYPVSGFIVIGIEEIKPAGVAIGFKKIGFEYNKEDWVRNEINNQMANVEPVPKVDINALHDYSSGRLFPVLKIEGEEVHRPYFVKGKGQCYVRIGASTTPASRTTVLSLFSNMNAKRTDIERLSSAAGFLKEALTYTCKNIRDIRPANIDARILGVDLTYVKNAALSTEWFLTRNNLLGGHHSINSFTGGFYSFIHDIEKLNSLIDTYNTSQSEEGKQKMKDSMQFWKPEHDEYNKAVGFLNNVIISCNDFISKIGI